MVFVYWGEDRASDCNTVAPHIRQYTTALAPGIPQPAVVRSRMLFRTPGECKGPHRPLLRQELMKRVIEDIHKELNIEISGEQIGLIRKVRHPFGFCIGSAQRLFADYTFQRSPFFYGLCDFFHDGKPGIVWRENCDCIAMITHFFYRLIEDRISQAILFGILCELFCTSTVINSRQLDVSYLGHSDSEELGDKPRAYISDSQRFFSIHSEIIIRVG